MTLVFFTTQLKCHQNTDRKDQWNTKVAPSHPLKKIGPAGQKKGNLLHVSSKFFQKITLKFWGRGEDHLKPKGGGSKQYQNNTYPLTFQYLGSNVQRIKKGVGLA